MDDLAKELYQTMVDVWLNYKHHLNDVPTKGKDTFWKEFIDDASVFDEKFRNDVVKYTFYLNFITGLSEATKEYFNAGNETH